MFILYQKFKDIGTRQIFRAKVATATTTVFLVSFKLLVNKSSY